MSLCGNVDAAGIRMPLHRFAGTIRRNKHRDDRAHGRLQNPLAQNDVRAGEPSRRWEARWNKWKGQAKYHLLIIDELGFVPLSKTGAELLFEVFSQRYERGSILVTSNLPFDEWTEIFGSERLTGALLDRLTHHVHILEMNGESYRLNQSQKRRKSPKIPA